MINPFVWYMWEQTNLQDPEPSHERQRLLFLTGLLMFKIPPVAVYYLIKLAKEIEVANNGPLVTLLTNAVIAAVNSLARALMTVAPVPIALASILPCSRIFQASSKQLPMSSTRQSPRCRRRLQTRPLQLRRPT